jgi:hypothetical protein
MRRLSVYLFLTAILFGLPDKADGQCKGFARRICKLDLENFVHDGNYHAAILTEGEEAELYKTFYADQDYRVAICGSDLLPGVEFSIMDNQRNVLYNNRDNDLKNIWDFRLESSQQLMISVRVPNGNPGKEPSSGCVAILFGFSDK